MAIKDPGLDWPLPTERDKTRIRRILLDYDKKHPGLVLATVKSARDQHSVDSLMSKEAKYGVVNEGAAGRHLFEIPEDLGQQIVGIAPFVFRSKRHLRWFIKNFPELLIPQKY